MKISPNLKTLRVKIFVEKDLKVSQGSFLLNFNHEQHHVTTILWHSCMMIIIEWTPGIKIEMQNNIYGLLIKKNLFRYLAAQVLTIDQNVGWRSN